MANCNNAPKNSICYNGKIVDKPFAFNGKLVDKVIYNGKEVVFQKNQYRNKWSETITPKTTQYRNRYTHTWTQSVYNQSCSAQAAQMGFCKRYHDVQHSDTAHTGWHNSRADANREHSGTVETRIVNGKPQTHIHYTKWYDTAAEANRHHSGTQEVRKVASTVANGS